MCFRFCNQIALNLNSSSDFESDCNCYPNTSLSESELSTIQFIGPNRLNLPKSTKYILLSLFSMNILLFSPSVARLAGVMIFPHQ